MKFEKAHPFFDLCISYECFQREFKNLKNTFTKLGYKTVAVNQEYVGTNGPVKKKKASSILPPPIQFEKDSNILWLNRLTIVLNEKKKSFSMMHDRNWKDYDVVAVRPESMEILQFCCDTMEIDIITFDPKDWKFAKLHPKHLRIAAERGIYFEISYSPAIDDLDMFSNITEISNSFQKKKFNNIVMTSSAEKALNIRSPYDLMNFGLILGLSKKQAQAAVSSACKDVLIHAESRKIGKSIILVEPAVPDEMDTDEIDTDVNNDRET